MIVIVVFSKLQFWKCVRVSEVCRKIVLSTLPLQYTSSEAVYNQYIVENKYLILIVGGGQNMMKKVPKGKFTYNFFNYLRNILTCLEMGQKISLPYPTKRFDGCNKTDSSSV